MQGCPARWRSGGIWRRCGRWRRCRFVPSAADIPHFFHVISPSHAFPDWTPEGPPRIPENECCRKSLPCNGSAARHFQRTVAPGNNRDIVGRISRWPDFRPHTPWSDSVLPVLLHSKIDSCFTLLFLLPISSETHFSESLILHLDSPRLRWMIHNIPDICSRIHVFVWTVRRYVGR